MVTFQVTLSVGFLYSVSVNNTPFKFNKVGNKHAVLCFCFLELGIRPSVFTEFNFNQVNLALVWIKFLAFCKLLKVWVAGGYARGAHSAR